MIIGYSVSTQVPQNIFRWSTDAIEQVNQLIEDHYVDSLNTKALAEKAIESTLKHLDPFSVYIPPAHLADVNDQIRGSFEGIGVEYSLSFDTPVVIRCVPGGGAEKAGIVPGDMLLACDTHHLVGKGVAISAVIKGPEGSKITLKVLRGRDTLSLPVSRGVIPISSSHLVCMLHDSIGYIELSKFTGHSHREVRLGMERLQKQGMKKLILDLRDNGGGLLESALEICNEFFPANKLIVYTQNEREPRKQRKYYTSRKGIFSEGQMVVLVNGGSASASEILAGALQDWDRATIVGTKTFGKGLVQEQFGLHNGGALRLTVSRYFTPLGRCIQKNYLSERNKGDNIVLAAKNRFRVDTFRTPKGKIVLSSGGIFPDVTVKDHFPFTLKPADTSALLRIVAHRDKYAILLQYFAHNTKALHQRYRHPRDFLARYTTEPSLFERFVHAYDKAISPSLSQALHEKIKLDLLRLLWPESDARELLLHSDNSVIKGIEILTH